MDFSKGFRAEIILTGESSSWSQKLDYENVSFHCRVCFETRHKATHCLKRPRQAKKLQRKSTWWDGAKEEHQMINKDEPDALDPPMDEPNSKSEENRDTSSKKQDVDPHDPVKEEVVIPPDLDQEAFKKPDVAPQDSLEQDYSTPSDLA
jgi:hypothetical protein